jgi:hypothetical protein
MVAAVASFKIFFEQNPGGMLPPSQGFLTDLWGCQNELKVLWYYSVSLVVYGKDI